MEPVLNDAKFKLKKNQISDICADTLCCFKNIYEQCFSRVSIKLDLFHATEWITKVLPDKKYLKKLPVNKGISLLSEIENLRKHVEKRCASSTQTGGGTENNERLHMYLNRKSK